MIDRLPSEIRDHVTYERSWRAKRYGRKSGESDSAYRARRSKMLLQERRFRSFFFLFSLCGVSLLLIDLFCLIFLLESPETPTFLLAPIWAPMLAIAVFVYSVVRLRRALRAETKGSSFWPPGRNRPSSF